MSRFTSASIEEIENAQLLHEAFEKCGPSNENKSNKKKRKSRKNQILPLSISISTELSDLTSLSVYFDDDNVFLKDDICRSSEANFDAFIYSNNPEQLELRLEFDGQSYNLSSPVECNTDECELIIQQWALHAPPRVYFNGEQINRGPGLHLEQVNELPEFNNSNHNVYLINRDVGPFDFPEPLDIYINDEYISNHETGWHGRNKPIQHTAKLPIGKHRVVVISRRRGWTLLDTDLLVDGVSDVTIYWTNPNLSSSEIEILYGPNTVFQENRDEQNYFETASKFQNQRNKIVIDGVEIPEGLNKYLEKIRKSKEFSELMIKNFKAFLEIKKRIKEKKLKGSNLTGAEIDVDAIDEYDKLDLWIEKRKEAEGYKTRRGGAAGMDGKIQDLTPEAKNAYEKLIKKVIMEVHEPSHIAGFKKKATGLGLDWEMVKKHLEVVNKLRAAVGAGQTLDEALAALTNEERALFDWGAIQNNALLRRYFELCKDPIDGALEEIQEYEAEVKFFNELLKKLRHQRNADKAARKKLLESRLGLIIQYYHSIKSTFKKYSDEEKKEMREKLEELKEHVDDAKNMNDKQKAELKRLLRESIRALN